MCRGRRLRRCGGLPNNPLKPRPGGRREAPCLNSDLPASTVTRRYHPSHLKRASVPTSACFAPRASLRSWAMSVRIAVVVLLPDQSDRRGIGRATTSLARIQQAPRPSTDLLIQRLMHSSRLRSKPSHRISAKMGRCPNRLTLCCCRGAASLAPCQEPC